MSGIRADALPVQTLGTPKSDACNDCAGRQRCHQHVFSWSRLGEPERRRSEFSSEEVLICATFARVSLLFYREGGAKCWCPTVCFEAGPSRGRYCSCQYNNMSQLRNATSLIGTKTPSVGPVHTMPHVHRGHKKCVSSD